MSNKQLTIANAREISGEVNLLSSNTSDIIGEMDYKRIANQKEMQILDTYFKNFSPIENLRGDIDTQVAQQILMLYNNNPYYRSQGVDQVISLLTRQAGRIIRSKYLEVPPAKYVFLDASRQHWLDKVFMPYELPELHDDFVNGISNVKYSNSMRTRVEPQFGGADFNAYTWRKHVAWTDEEIKKYTQTGVYPELAGSLIDIKQRALKRNCDLGFQKFLMVGHPDAPEYKSFMGYVMGSTPLMKSAELPNKPLSQMNTAELQVWMTSILNLYRKNTQYIKMPNRLLLPPSEFIALGASGSPQVSGRTRAEIIEGFFKDKVKDFKIEELIYLSKEFNGTGDDYACFYRYDRESLFVQIPYVAQFLPLYWMNGNENLVRVMRFRFSDLFCAYPETFMAFKIPVGDPDFKYGAFDVNVVNADAIGGKKDNGKKDPVEEAMIKSFVEQYKEKEKDLMKMISDLKKEQKKLLQEREAKEKLQEQAQGQTSNDASK